MLGGKKQITRSERASGQWILIKYYRKRRVKPKKPVVMPLKKGERARMLSGSGRR